MIFLCSLVGIVAIPIQAQFIKSGSVIHTCGDGAGWPPYTFFKRVNGQKTEEIIGYDVDVLKAIGAKHRIKFTVSMPPWKRCRKRAKKGKKFQIALSASYNKERERDYLMSRDYYSLTPHYFYSKIKYPKGLAIKTIRDTKQYRICGLFGYNYVGFQPHEINQDSKIFPDVIKSAHYGKCDLFLARYEILAGFSVIGEPYLNDTLGNAPYPDVPTTKFHMLISRKYKFAHELKALIDREITELEGKGQLQKILSKYIK